MIISVLMLSEKIYTCLSASACWRMWSFAFTANNVVLEQATLDTDTWKWRHLASGYYTFCSIASKENSQYFKMLQSPQETI